MNVPCPSRVVCPGPQPGLDGDFPITNYTAEIPDTVSFEGIGFTYPIFNQNNTIGGDNTTGNFPAFFADAGCLSLCVSFLSQDDANACAARQAFICAHTPPTGPPPTFFFNQQQSASFVCPDGSLFTFTVLPGYFVALSLAEANELAFALAVERAIQNHVCMGPLTSTAQVGVPYSSTMSLLGNFPIGVSIVSGQVPPGLVMSQDPGGKTFTLSGTPTTAGTFNFALMATDPFGNFTVRSYTITVTGNCNTVFGHPSWNITFSSPPNPPFSNASGSASGLSFSIESDSNGLVVPVQSNADFGVNGPLLTYTLGIALTCKLTLTVVQVASANNAVVLTAVDQNNVPTNLLILAPAPLGTNTFTFTIPANTQNLHFQAAVVGGNGAGVSGSASMNGNFSG